MAAAFRYRFEGTMKNNWAALVVAIMGAIYFAAKVKSTSAPCSWDELQGSFWLPVLLLAAPCMLLGCGWFAFEERTHRQRGASERPIARSRPQLIIAVVAAAALITGGLVVVGALMTMLTCGLRG
jgi:hypothetical protein